jgi:putative flavoprotein involved in K+ transport
MTTPSPDDVLNRWLSAFANALSRGDLDNLQEQFLPDAYWRDILAFTWNIHTAEGRPAIVDMLRACLAGTTPRGWEADGPAREENGVVEATLTFETNVARCQAVVRLRNGRCWTLMTSMRELQQHEETAGARRPSGHVPTAPVTVHNTNEPYCLIIGAGHSGLALGARLKQLGVPTLIIERQARPGDTWRNRYDGLHLHSPVWYDHMPYLPFPETWPVHPSKDQVATWLDSYADVMELDVWTATECHSAVFDDIREEWCVKITRNTRPMVLRPKHLVLASGLNGAPKVPKVLGMQTFQGEQHHASAHRDSRLYAGQRCVVVGAGTSAHDISQALCHAGADVTMVQRSPTIVVRLESVLEVFAGAYSEAAVARGLSAEKADLLSAATPHRLLAAMQIWVSDRMRETDAAFYAALTKAGFLLHFGQDSSGLLAQLFRQASGYYLDVGASGLIIDGSIKLKSGVGLSAVKKRSVLLSDGTELPADLIVYATGYEPPITQAAQILPPEMIHKIGRLYGLGSGIKGDPGPWAGEPRNLWKPTQQQALWFHGGGFGWSRFFSRTLALQIKARHAGIATPIHALAPAAPIAEAAAK